MRRSSAFSAIGIVDLFFLFFVFLLILNALPAVDLIPEQLYRVHFFRSPDGQWLSMLNLRVVFQVPDVVDVEEESVEEPLDFDDNDDWTVITLDLDKEKLPRNWTQAIVEGRREEDEEVLLSSKAVEKEEPEEEEEEEEKQIGRFIEEVLLEESDEGGEEEESILREETEETGTFEEMESEAEMKKEKEEEKEEEKGIMKKEEENDKQEEKMEAKMEKVPKDDEKARMEMIPELSLLRDILPWIPHVLRRHHHRVHKPKHRFGKMPMGRLHLEDILSSSSTTSTSPAEEATTEISTFTEADAQMTEEEQSSFPSSEPTTEWENETSTTEPPPPLEPINEEELALNLHRDSLHRNESMLRQMFGNESLQGAAAGAVGTGRRQGDQSAEAFRDLGGSFILPLLKELKYDNKSIPLVFPDQSLKVAVSLEILHLGNFDNFQMEYELDMLFHLQWFDVRLANNFSKSVRIKEQQIIDKIWKPDTLFFNSKYSYFHLVSFPNFLMRIRPDGHITYTSRVTLLPDCQMNFCNFPHDTQRCRLLISSIAHPRSMLEYNWDPEQPIVFAKQISLPDLHIQEIGTGPCSIGGKLIPSSCLSLSFVLERASARYIAEKYMPSTLAMIFSWVAPYVPYNYEEVRIITPITVLLTLVQMEKGNQEVITSYLTSLDIWFVVIKAFTVLSLVESLTVMAYIKRGRAVEKQAQRASNEYQKDVLQAEAKRIVRVYHRLDHFSRVCFPVAFLCFLIFYVGFIVQRDEQSCREQLIDLDNLDAII